jgi:hypothetical protein
MSNEGQPASRFAIPPKLFTQPDLHPVGYLERFPVSDPSEKLSEGDAAALGRLFEAAARACVEKYHQDYVLATKAPIYQLLKTNNPGVAQLERERGGVVFLGEVAAYLAEQRASRSPPSREASERGTVFYYSFAAPEYVSLRETDIHLYGCEYFNSRPEFLAALSGVTDRSGYREDTVRAKVDFGDRVYFVDLGGVVRDGDEFRRIDKERFERSLVPNGLCAFPVR